MAQALKIESPKNNPLNAAGRYIISEKNGSLSFVKVNFHSMRLVSKHKRFQEIFESISIWKASMVSEKDFLLVTQSRHETAFCKQLGIVQGNASVLPFPIKNDIFQKNVIVFDYRAINGHISNVNRDIALIANSLTVIELAVPSKLMGRVLSLEQLCSYYSSIASFYLERIA